MPFFPLAGGDTPLIDACRFARIADVTALLQSGANVNEPKTDHSGASPLCIASQEGHLDVVLLLLSAGATVNQACTDSGCTPLFVACQNDHLEVVTTLLAAGAAVDQANRYGVRPLLSATARWCQTEIIAALCSAGAAVDQGRGSGDHTPMLSACLRGNLEAVQVLSSFGAARCPNPQAQPAWLRPPDHIVAWLATSHQWSTALHHLPVIGAKRARALLRAGADLHARADAAGPTPLSLARALRAAGNCADGSAAQLVLMAAEPWCPRTHALFPAGARAFAAELLLLGHRLSRQPRFEGEEVSLSDIWLAFVMPHAVVR